ncbi:MAG TPA: hypothetical protein VGP93_11930 [Polyangiaceae bacterium]|nr:hypothetical protein [Polyangiaceae bacterium]
MRRDPFPTELVRDLLGIARALYAAWAAEDADDARLTELEALGRELREALALGAKSPPDTMGSRTAWERAERATEALALLVGSDVGLRPLLRAVGDKLREPVPLISKSEERKRRQRERG